MSILDFLFGPTPTPKTHPKKRYKSIKDFNFQHPKKVDVFAVKFKISKNDSIFAYDFNGKKIPGIPSWRKELAIKFNIYLGKKKVPSGYRWVWINPKDFEKTFEEEQNKLKKKQQLQLEKQKQEKLKKQQQAELKKQQQAELKKQKQEELKKKQQAELKKQKLEAQKKIDQNSFFINNPKTNKISRAYTEEEIKELLNENKINLKTEIKKGKDTKTFKQVLDFKIFIQDFDEFL